MTVYWLLFAYAAVMALIAPAQPASGRVGLGQSLAVVGFAFAYIAIAGLRFEIGGDWLNYAGMYDLAGQSTLLEAMRAGDPGFGMLLWLSARAGWDIYPANALCAGLLVWGVVRVALTTREPWMAILASVPYLLIVVGMGYVRQAGAIGLVLLAIAEIGRRRWSGTVAALVLAPTLHLTSAITFPLVLRTLARGRRGLSVALLVAGAGIFAVLISTRYATYQQNYIDEEYDSGGAMVRLAMNALPSLFILLRWRHFPLQGRLRDIWLGFALANLAAVAAMALSPSSTAVDRMALYFSPIQIVMFGCMMDLLPLSRRMAFLVRSLGIVMLACVQVVWLTLGTYADAWVPYRSVFELP